ncbi:MAG TPA: hypothetical protein VK894_04925 [Jiangellales bacterium]|nr:hypothetical protein [Jiangellales bacterium]
MTCLAAGATWVLDGTTVGGNVQVGTEAVLDARGVTVDGNLQCESDDPAPTGGGNAVPGDKEGQCSGL